METGTNMTEINICTVCIIELITVHVDMHTMLNITHTVALKKFSIKKLSVACHNENLTHKVLLPLNKYTNEWFFNW